VARWILQIEITSRDVGGTQAATISLGNKEIVSFMTYTGYEERSLEIAEEKIVDIFREFLEGKLDYRDMSEATQRLKEYG